MDWFNLSLSAQKYVYCILRYLEDVDSVETLADRLVVNRNTFSELNRIGERKEI